MEVTPAYKRLLLTGAAGGLGRVLRPAMRGWAPALRVSDIAPLGGPAAGEELAPCDLGDEQAVRSLVEGVDGIVHMGGISTDQPWAPILNANIVGVYNLYESARIHGVRRVVFASSNHAIGFYPRSQRIDADDPVRPDSLYGVSKTFGESLSRFYFDRYGIETVCLRIGSSFPEPKDRRMLVTWLSYADLTGLVRASLFAPRVGHTIAFGASANRDSWWDNRKAAHLGWVPRDSSERFRAAREAEPPPEKPDSPAEKLQGGAYVTMGPYE
ncbi:MAG TPA: NAD(P)-dependent oxidoreductase [Usitatibacter sp.]|nr:NAD(P)-dependent oxidoreductase [Usitatibacter sp.]